MSAALSPVLTTVTTSLSTAMSPTLLPMILGMAAIAFWAGVFMVTSRANGDNGNVWRGIQDQVSKVISSSMLAMFILLVTSIIYFLQDQTKHLHRWIIL